MNAPENRPSRRLDDKPLTSDEINEFLAHSDGDISSDESDWNDIRDEDELSDDEESKLIIVEDQSSAPATEIPMPSTSKMVIDPPVKGKVKLG